MNAQAKRITNETILVLLGIVFVFPLILVIFNSFKSYADIYNSPFSLPTSITFANYITVIKGMNYFRKIFNSFFVTILPIPFILVFGSMAAYKMVRTKTKFSTFLFYFTISTMLIPIHVIIVPLLVQARVFQLVNKLYGLVLIYIGLHCPFTVFLYHGFIKNIPKDVEESAYIDGCTSLGIYFRIIFPMLKPISVTITIISALYFWNDFFLPMILISSSSKRTLPLTAFRYIGEYMKDWPLLLPAAVLLSIPILLFFLVLQRYILAGIGEGAVKG
jgi:raffinose/stachyose/melibiose transport system permease protein